MEKELKLKTDIDTKSAAQSIDNLNEKIETLKDKLEKLNPKTTKFKNLAIQLNETTDELERVNKKIDVIGKSGNKLETLVSITETISGGFAAAQSTAELFGVKVEGISVVIDKVSKANEILNTVQQVNTALQKEGVIATNLSTIYQKANTLATTAATAVQKLFSKSVKTTQGSLKGLKAAIVGTGIGALIVGVGLLVEKIMDWTGSTEDQENKQAELNQKLAEEKRLLEETTQATIDKWNAQENGLNSKKRELKVLEASGKTEEEVYNKKKEIYDKELFALLYRKQVMKEFPKDVAKINQEILDKQNEFNVETINFKNKVVKRDSEAQKKADEEAKKRQEKKDQDTKDENDAFIKTQDEKLRLLELKNALTEDEELKSLNEIKAKELLSENEYEIQLLEIRNKYKEKAKQKEGEEKDRYKELKEKRIEINQTFVASEQNNLDISLQKSQSAYEKQINLQKDLFIKGKINQETYKKNIIDIEKSRVDEITQIQTDFNANANADLESYITKQTEILDQQKDAKIISEADYNLSIKALQDERKNVATSIAEQADQTIINATTNLENVTKSLFEEGGEEKKKLIKSRYDYWVNTATEATSILDNLDKLASSNGKKQNDVQKGLAIAKVGIDTGIALSNALRNASSPTPDNQATGGLAGVAKYIALAAQIYTNFRTIKGLISGSGGGSTGASGGDISAPSVSAPQIAAPQFGGTEIQSSQHIAEPIKVFVTEADIRKAQNKVNVIEGQSVVV